MNASFETRRLGRTDLDIPLLGIGASPFGNRARELTPQDVEDTVTVAMDAGLCYFDVAPYYGFGLAERRLGDALRAYSREDVIVSTKVGRRLDPSLAPIEGPRNGFLSRMPFTPAFDYSYDGVMRSHEASLHRLGLARIDILLVHDLGAFAHGDDHPARFAEFMDGGYRALQELRAAGDIAAFGLGVNETAICEQVLANGDLDCILLAGRYTLLEQAPLDGFLQLCLDRSVGVIVGGPYNSGLLAGGTRREGALRYDYGEAPADILDKVRRIETVCDAHQVSIAAVALQFPVGHPAVSSVIPGLGSAARVTQTIKLLRTPIPAAFWNDLKSAGLLRTDAPVPGVNP